MMFRELDGCPNCGKAIWGEGWDRKTRHFYSHVNQSDASACFDEIAISILGTYWVGINFPLLADSKAGEGR